MCMSRLYDFSLNEVMKIENGLFVKKKLELTNLGGQKRVVGQYVVRKGYLKLFLKFPREVKVLKRRIFVFTLGGDIFVFLNCILLILSRLDEPSTLY